MKNVFNQFTLRTLQRNKVRTIVTIIGITLSVAMFAAVTSIITSFQQYMVDMEEKNSGTWEGWASMCSASAAKELQAEKEVKDSTRIADLGYARLQDCQNGDKPYLYVMGIQDTFTDFAPVYLKEGRMPKSDKELVISEHLLTDGGIDWKVGDNVLVELGRRVDRTMKEDGEAADTANEIGGQFVPYMGDEQETLKDTCEKRYVIVGICERMNNEDYEAPGYTALTLDNGGEAPAYDLLVTLHHPQRAEKLLGKYCGDSRRYRVHSALLRYRGKSINRRFNTMLYSMGAILIAVIMIGSTSLIYNAFSISVSERTKQFGLLKSVGATRKQIRHSVFFEACFLSMIGVPLGLIIGIGGIGVTLHFVGGLFHKLLGEHIRGNLSVYVTWQSVLISVIIGVVTVLISAMVPAARAMRRSAIESIRQSDDILLRPEKFHTSSLVFRLFGFEAMIASKNFKRNRKRYRTTILSLFISVVLFVTATSFTGYLEQTIDLERDKTDYDIAFSMPEDADNVSEYVSGISAKNKSERMHQPDKIAEGLSEVECVDEVGFERIVRGTMDIPLQYVDEEYLSVIRKMYSDMVDSEKQILQVDVQISYTGDETYQKYLEGCKSIKKDVDEYMNPENGTCLMWDSFISVVDKKYYSLHLFREKACEGELRMITPPEGMSYFTRQGDKYTFGRFDKNGNIIGEKSFPAEEISISRRVAMHRCDRDIMPLGVTDRSMMPEVHIALPYSYGKSLGLWKNKEDTAANFHIRASDHAQAYENIKEEMPQILGGRRLQSQFIIDVTEGYQSEQALLKVVDVFAYGFIILISLISVANVFHTISTNIRLRRQEFAMLRSVGMTEKGFQRMMSYECILYGAKGLLAGIPVSLVVSYLMYHVMQGEWNADFIIPWQGMLIASVSVFLVVFVTMLYAISKIRKENIIEALRSEAL